MKYNLSFYPSRALHRRKEKTRRKTRKRILSAWLVAGLFAVWPTFGFAEGNLIKKRDVDKDGMIDQTAEFNPSGELVLLTLDDNRDGVMDTFQYYVGGEIVRLEKNTDAEPGVDMRTYFKDGRKIRQERLDAQGNVYQTVDLDIAGRPFEIREDTNADQRIDTVYHIEKGQIARITRDPDGDGGINAVELYDNGALVERRNDVNGDGMIEERLFFSKAGALSERHLDTDQNGDLDMTEVYRNGQVHLQQWDRDRDQLFERIVYFEKGDIIRIEEDSDMDGIRETRVVYRNGKPSVQTVDANQDGKEELRIFYDSAGETERIEQDISLDGTMDTFQRYEDSQLVFVEKDTTGDGKIDTKIAYDPGRQIRTLRDRDHDGRFETTHRYDRPPWTRVTEIDSNKSGRIDAVFHELQYKRKFEFHSHAKLYRSAILELEGTDVPLNRISYKPPKSPVIPEIKEPLSDSNSFVIPGKEYQAGFFTRLFFGDQYRDTWAAEVEIPVLNVETTFDGLTPYHKNFCN